ncbi:MAG: 16S rRNA (adenine(1518)-N(6)/adenine(1519)-N(6))-dimethyltransferase RsmA [Aaplasma endosymbiont of Hyalomma asiaticum]
MRHRTRKSLGQNFLSDPHIAGRIVSYAGNIKDHNIVEVGPGLGIMTKIILNKGVKKLVAIEKDKRLIAVHNRLQDAYPEYECIFEDILEADIEDLTSKTPTKMIANLPYNISVVLLLKLLGHIRNYEKLILMFQREVASRLVALPRTKSYSILSVLVQLLCDVRKIEDLPPEVFTPSPKVFSSVVEITPLPAQRYSVDYKHLQKVLKLLFHCKRKNIRNVLKLYVKDIDSVLQKCSIPHDIRAESLSVKEICTLSNSLQESGSFR